MFFASIRNSLSRTLGDESEGNPFGGKLPRLAESLSVVSVKTPDKSPVSEENEDEYLDLDTLFK